MTACAKSPLLIVDNRDDRREVWRLLKRLGPRRLLAFLSWCCSQATLPHGKQRPRVSQSTKDLAVKARWDTGSWERLLRETWMDLWMLVNNYDFDLDAGLARLVSMAREPR